MENVQIKMPTFCTVRQFATLGIISEYGLRRLIREHKCPGYHSGTRFYVNQTALIDLLSNAGAGNGLEGEGNND